MWGKRDGGEGGRTVSNRDVTSARVQGTSTKQATEQRSDLHQLFPKFPKSGNAERSGVEWLGPAGCWWWEGERKEEDGRGAVRIIVDGNCGGGG